jgi:hypothetical protein
MTVLVTRGYGKESSTIDQQNRFLNDLKNLLLTLDLEIESVKSERETGGPIKLETVTDNPDLITRSFLALATSLARDHYSETGEENIEVEFELRLPNYCSEPILIIGTIH